VRDEDCVRFLQWALPRLGLRWEGFRRPRRQVCRRIDRRRRELGLADVEAYRGYLEAHPEEEDLLDRLCRVTISRFYRDGDVFQGLERSVLPELARRAAARGRRVMEAWSAGCASGEEPYTLALVWALALAGRFPGLELVVLATDVDEAVLRRAEQAVYGLAGLRDLPPAWRERAFDPEDGRFRLRRELRSAVRFLRHDLRRGAPDGPFDLVLCRNLAFTYFGPELQAQTASLLSACLRPGGALVVGARERLPEGAKGFLPWSGVRGAYRRAAASGEEAPLDSHRRAVGGDPHSSGGRHHHSPVGLDHGLPVGLHPGAVVGLHRGGAVGHNAGLVVDGGPGPAEHLGPHAVSSVQAGGVGAGHPGAVVGLHPALPVGEDGGSVEGRHLRPAQGDNTASAPGYHPGPV